MRRTSLIRRSPTGTPPQAPYKTRNTHALGVCVLATFTICAFTNTTHGDTESTEQSGTEQSETSSLKLRKAPIDDNLVTDRPDFTESTEAIPVGRFQLEMGYTFTYDRENTERFREHTTPELLLRVGIVEDFELRFAWTGYSFTETQKIERDSEGRRVKSENGDQDASDFELGFKLKIAEQKGLCPHLAILGAMTFPTGSKNVSPGDVEPLTGLLWAYDLSDNVALAGQFLIGAPVEDSRRFVQTAASLSLGVSLTEQLGTYVEYFGTYQNSRESDSAHSINAGFTYLITNNLQIDIRAGFGINEEADDFFTGTGLSWRF